MEKVQSFGFSCKLTFSDEGHFTLYGFVNKQKRSDFGKSNFIKMNPTTICGFWVFFEHANERAGSINAGSYK